MSSFMSNFMKFNLIYFSSDRHGNNQRLIFPHCASFMSEVDVFNGMEGRYECHSYSFGAVG